MTENFKSDLEKILKKDKRLVDENGELNANLIHEYASSLDEGLIDLLLNEKATKDKFFLKVKDVYVFKQSDFKFFLDENKIDNSYTQFANRIGLSTGGKFLKDIDDVVLDFPYKDCVLEGGQSREEGMDTYFEYNEEQKEYIEKEAKRKEIFFNQVLAKDEIDRLTEPKALTNVKRYTEKGVEKIKAFKRDKDGKVKDNLVIKGNNLLTLHSIKEQFNGKIKFIYIDPPYNTPGDKNDFSYNNNFNHSTWCTFIKNRLEISKKLLTTDGFIAIAIDHNELFYLGVLADEVFGRNNRVGIVTVLHNPKGRNQAAFFSDNSDFMMVYANDKSIGKFNKVAIDENVKASFTENDEDGSFRWESFIRARTVWSKDNRPKNWYPLYVSKDLTVITSEKVKGYYELYPTTDSGDFAWKNIRTSFETLNLNNYFRAVKEGEKIYIQHKYYEQQVYKNVWTDKKYQSEFHGTNLLKKLIGKNNFSYPKSIYTVIDIIKIVTNPGDIVLDYFGGSATTAQAVLDINSEAEKRRQFLIVEQLDEHFEVLTKRLQKVVKDNGGAFVTIELAKNNQKAIGQIKECKSLKELVKLFDELYEKYFLSYNVKVKEFKEKISKEKEFQNLSLERQKEIFARMLDLNQLYVNVSDMEDSQFKLSKEDIALTKDFYQL